jgi:hypothetical protein
MNTACENIVSTTLPFFCAMPHRWRAGPARTKTGIMENILTILILLAILAVSVTLGLGLWSLKRSGEDGGSRSNRLMRLRVALQALAILLLIIGMWWKSTHAG